MIFCILDLKNSKVINNIKCKLFKNFNYNKNEIIKFNFKLK